MDVLFLYSFSGERRFTWNAEIVFEEQDFDGFLSKLKEYPDIEYLGEVIEHSWGQRVIRFYDLDGHILGGFNETFEQLIHDGRINKSESKEEYLWSVLKRFISRERYDYIIMAVYLLKRG